jgi:hypothetical protein
MMKSAGEQLQGQPSRQGFSSQYSQRSSSFFNCASVRKISSSIGFMAMNCCLQDDEIMVRRASVEMLCSPQGILRESAERNNENIARRGALKKIAGASRDSGNQMAAADSIQLWS